MNAASGERQVRRWLVASAIAVLAALLLGGITRLTESGLSITVWEPIRGIIPPRSAADWQDAFERFRQIPQARTVHAGMTLEQFRVIYWWEWTHRILARVVGLVLIVPFFVLLARKAIRPPLRWRLALLPVLAVAQGFLGWYMVSSGLTQRVSVSPYRLAAHLAMALVIWAICVWTLLDLTPVGASGRISHRLRRSTVGLAWLAAVTLTSGALVAGLDGGKVFNTFPRMGEGLIPPGYGGAMRDWRAIFENPVVAQFHHRVLAVLTLLATLALFAWIRRSGAPAPLHRAILAAVVLGVIQVSLGIATLLLSVPTTLAVLHQANGLLFLGALIRVAHRGRSAVPSPGELAPCG